MEARMHLMVGYDRQPMCVFASHYAKETAHGQSTKKRRQTEVLYPHGSEEGYHHYARILKCATAVVENWQSDGSHYPHPGYQGTV